MKKRYHVVPSSHGQWAIKRGDTDRSSKTFDKKSDAVDAARTVAKSSGGELVVHGRDGRIRSADTYPAGYGSLKGQYKIRKGLDLTKPLFEQSSKKTKR
jgi:hypothetical protein